SDAIAAVAALQPPRLSPGPEQAALRERLLRRLRRLQAEGPEHERVLAAGGPHTFLHGDLWTTNTFVQQVEGAGHVRLIDWDHAGVGPAAYDLSTFLLRFPRERRAWVLECYRDAMGNAGWRMPGVRELNLLFETFEFGRCANRLIWPAIALLHDRA